MLSAPCRIARSSTRVSASRTSTYVRNYVIHRLPALSRRVHIASSATQLHEVTSTEQDSGVQHLEVGLILTTHGVKGEVKVQALTDFPEERLLTPGTR